MILAAGLTPAWQQIVLLDQLRLDAVNRARAVHWCAAGKVLNVSLALHQLGARVKTLSIAGGPSGAALRQELREAGLEARWIESPTPTRVCTTILETGRQTTTELVQNSSPITEAELDAFRKVFAEETATADTVILSGSLPEGTPPTLYAEVLRGYGGRCILDIRGPELMQALSCRPFLVKPNREELAASLHRPLPDDAALLEAMRGLNEKGAEWVVITHGKEAVLVTSATEAYAFLPPAVEQVLNPIGSGDAMAAGIAWALAQGQSPLDAIRWGMAAAASGLQTLRPARLDTSKVADLVPRIQPRNI